MEKFWLVCNEGATRTSRRYTSFGEATGEATRLASVTQRPAVVMEAVGAMRPPPSPAVWEVATEEAIVPRPVPDLSLANQMPS